MTTTTMDPVTQGTEGMMDSVTSTIPDMLKSATTMMASTASDLMSTAATTTTTMAPEEDEVTTVDPLSAPLLVMKHITGDIPEFEIILPCIFGIFVILSLSLMVFYTKNPDRTKKEAAHEMDVQENGKADNSWF